MCTIERYPNTLEPAADGANNRVYVRGDHPLADLRLLVGLGERRIAIEFGLDHILIVIAELAATRREELDAIVLPRVVRGREHRGRYRQGGTHMRDRWRRNDAEVDDAHSPGGTSLRKGAQELGAGFARVSTDEKRLATYDRGCSGAKGANILRCKDCLLYTSDAADE